MVRLGKLAFVASLARAPSGAFGEHFGQLQCYDPDLYPGKAANLTMGHAPDVRHAEDCPIASCTANDAEIISADIEVGDGGCAAFECTPCEQVTGTLVLTIRSNINTALPVFAYYGTITETLQDGQCGCDAALPANMPNSCTTSCSDERCKDEGDNGGLAFLIPKSIDNGYGPGISAVDFGEISWTCGAEIELLNSTLIWTDRGAGGICEKIGCKDGYVGRRTRRLGQPPVRKLQGPPCTAEGEVCVGPGAKDCCAGLQCDGGTCQSAPSTPDPTQSPTASPTSSPTQSPSTSPTRNPTSAPATGSPTSSPTGSPSSSPTGSPTSSPTSSPSTSPTHAPTMNTPSSSPTQSPTASPVIPGTQTQKPTWDPYTTSKCGRANEIKINPPPKLDIDVACYSESWGGSPETSPINVTPSDIVGTLNNTNCTWTTPNETQISDENCTGLTNVTRGNWTLEVTYDVDGANCQLTTTTTESATIECCGFEATCSAFAGGSEQIEGCAASAADGNFTGLFSGVFIETSGCGNLTETSSDSAISSVCDNAGAVTRTYTLTDDASGASTECTETLTVADSTAPDIDAPANETAECDAIPDVGTPTTGDTCDAEPTVTYDGQTNNTGNCAGEYTLTRTWTATDNCGNSDSDSQTIAVVDTTPPSIDAPADETNVQCDAVPGPGTPTASDLCSVASVTYDGEIKTDESCAGNYTLNRTWTAMDECGNDASDSQTIAVVDTTPPSIDAPADETNVQCDAVPGPGTPTTSDNCSPIDSPLGYNEVKTDESCAGNYTLNRTWTAVDECGNDASDSQTIAVVDTTDPTFTTVPGNLVDVECSAIPDVGTAEASDNCDLDPTVAFVREDRADGICDDSYTLTRTWTATDDCGNDVDATQTIAVVDTTAPTFNEVIPADATVQCDLVPVADVLTADDNCGTATVVPNEVRTDGSCDDSYTLTRTWTATDDCSNSLTKTQVVTVQDTTAPDIICPANTTWSCDNIENLPPASPAYTDWWPTADDNCDTDLNGTGPAPQTTETCCPFANDPNAPDPNGIGIKRTFNATDDCGNSASCDQYITFNCSNAQEARRLARIYSEAQA